MKKTPRRRKALTAQQLVDQLADMTLPEDPPDFGETLTDARAHVLWRALQKHVRAEGNEHYSDQEIADRFERLQEALPESMRMEFTRYDDYRGDQAAVEQRAAYLVGVAVGRRMGAAR